MMKAQPRITSERGAKCCIANNPNDARAMGELQYVLAQKAKRPH